MAPDGPKNAGSPNRLSKLAMWSDVRRMLEHWHGATDETSVAHYAIQGSVEGAAVVWGDHVTDEDYRQ